ncbi:hypothetical protein SAMN05216262_12815 [Colwellia chukchiensis]|uniref:Adenylate cyclase, class 3 n=2 Tax=Colwelliaceae TaxID=267889 RepID=A0A1H7TS53_9GAMM|nr:hypothetical protein [Colwellia chukchiensis]SEL87428.1 hypothetical protein SAMN05216262_12815 [Colwellia chukchiensis]
MYDNYEKRLCLFLDILGFSSLVKTMECSTVHEVVSDIKHTLKSNKEFMSKIGSEPIATTFSDCIVLSIATKESYVESAANILVTATVRMLQDTYLNQSIALRGGMSYGELYHARDAVFGPAMIRAYELESQFADWPRVIFDKTVIDHLSNKGGLLSIGFTDYGDGFWGVDCLNRVEDILNVEVHNLFDSDVARAALEKLCQIRDITQNKLTGSYGNPKVYSKYLKLDARIYSLMKKFGQVPALFE